MFPQLVYEQTVWADAHLLDQAHDEEEESVSLTPSCQPQAHRGKKDPRDGADGADQDSENEIPGRRIDAARQGGKGGKRVAHTWWISRIRSLSSRLRFYSEERKT